MNRKVKYPVIVQDADERLREKCNEFMDITGDKRAEAEFAAIEKYGEAAAYLRLIELYEKLDIVPGCTYVRNRHCAAFLLYIAGVINCNPVENRISAEMTLREAASPFEIRIPYRNTHDIISALKSMEGISDVIMGGDADKDGNISRSDDVYYLLPEQYDAQEIPGILTDDDGISYFNMNHMKMPDYFDHIWIFTGNDLSRLEKAYRETDITLPLLRWKMTYTDRHCELIKKIGWETGNGFWDRCIMKHYADGKPLDSLIASNDDIFDILIRYGIDHSMAYYIAMYVNRGERQKYSRKGWKEYVKIMKAHGIEDWIIDSMEQVTFLFSRLSAAQQLTKEYTWLFLRKNRYEDTWLEE